MSAVHAEQFWPTPPENAGGPPANLDAEQAVLGAVLFDNGFLERVQDIVRPEHFFEPFHQRLFVEMATRIGRGQLADPILLQDAFATDPGYLELGGLAYLAKMMDHPPWAAQVPDYAETVKDLAIRRSLIRISSDLAGSAMATGDRPAKDIVEEAEAALFALSEAKTTGGGFIPFNEVLAGSIRMAAEAFDRDGGLAGISTGLTDLDRKLGGLHPSDLVILAGRPSQGKTALATNIAFQVASHYRAEPEADGSLKTARGGIVAFFSLEMSAEQLGLRILAEVSGVSSDRIRKGEIDANEYGRIRDSAIAIQSSPLHVDDTGGLSISRLCARARRMKRTTGLDLIIVDYLQLVTTNRKQGDGRVQEVSEITLSLKALAKELSVPVIALSQLSRKVEERDDKRPQLADLRESGSIEQDADVVMFVFREAYYKSRSEPRPGTQEHMAWSEEMDRLKHQAEVIIGKQRHGPIGTVRLSFNEDLTKFGNAARESDEARFNPHWSDR